MFLYLDSKINNINCILHNIIMLVQQYIAFNLNIIIKFWECTFQVINFFSYKLQQKDQSQLGVSQVLATIQQGTLEWPRDRLRVRINRHLHR